MDSVSCISSISGHFREFIKSKFIKKNVLTTDLLTTDLLPTNNSQLPSLPS